MEAREGQAGPTVRFWSKAISQGLNPFLFSRLFSNLQITLNSTQIRILNDSYLHTRTQEHFIT
jgi:hypothetical protein